MKDSKARSLILLEQAPENLHIKGWLDLSGGPGLMNPASTIGRRVQQTGQG